MLCSCPGQVNFHGREVTKTPGQTKIECYLSARQAGNQVFFLALDQRFICTGWNSKISYTQMKIGQHTKKARATVDNSYLYIGNLSHKLSSFSQVCSRRVIRLEYKSSNFY